MNDSTTQVRRYDIHEHSHDISFLRESVDGDYVRWTDYDTALAQVATLTKERDKTKADWEALMLLPFARNFSALETERDLLLSEVEGLREFATHHGWCSMHTPMPMESSKTYYGPECFHEWRAKQVCNCGFAALSPASGGKP